MRETYLEGFLLSPLQRQLSQWIDQQTKHPFLTSVAFELPGPLNLPALRAALQRLVSCHEILRTTFIRPHHSDIPLQVIQSDTHQQLFEILALNDPSSEMPENDLTEQLEAQNWSVQNLPQIRMGYGSSSGSTVQLVVMTTTMTCDIQGLLALVKELVTAYSSTDLGSPIEPELQYVHYSSWYQELLESEDATHGRTYWRSMNPEQALRLRLPGGKTTQGTYRPAWVRQALPTDLRVRLKAFSNAHGFTQDTLWLGLWFVCLRLHLDITQIIVGLVLQNRDEEAIAEIPGLFQHQVPIAAQIDLETSFLDLCATLETASIEAKEWQECFSWEDQVAANQPSMVAFPFGFERFPPIPALPKGAITAFKSVSFANSVSFCLDSDGDNFELRFCGNRLEPLLIETLCAQLLDMAAQLVSKPDLCVSDFNCAGPLQQAQVLNSFSQTLSLVPPYQSIPKYFQDQVQKTPQATAFLWTTLTHTQAYTYEELDSLTSAMAEDLCRKGVGPEVPVGLYLSSRPERILVMLAVLKTGGYYIPLDPDYQNHIPPYAIEDAGISLFITEAKWWAKLSFDGDILDIDTWNSPSKPSAVYRPVPIHPEQLAYTIYTSGSSGKPKGVQITHANLIASTFARTFYYHSAPRRFLLLSSYAFDSSVAGIYGTLLRGGTLVLTSQEEAGNSLTLTSFLAKHAITDLLTVPSYYRQILQSLNEAESHLTTAIVAGEACPAQLVKEHFQTIPQCALHNEYGPTEATVWATAFEFTEEVPEENYIGKPIANAGVYVVNAQMQPVPPGVAGQLLIGGTGLARAYLNRPAQTAAAFIPNPFSPIAGDRLYQTGDLVRFHYSGNLSFLGRIDHQIKLRGFRIEPSDIEHQLNQLPNIHASVVTLFTSETGQKHLVAYVAISDGKTASPLEIREALSERLPATMVPQIIQVLERMPLNDNGKIDRKALPAPNLAELAEKNYVPPDNEIEAALSEVWSEILGIEPIGTQHTFFELGGDSILSIRMLAKANARGIKFTLGDLLENQTIAKLAAFVDEGLATSYQVVQTPPFALLPESELPFLPDSLEDAYPLSALQEGMVFHNEFDPDGATYHEVISAHLQAELDLSAFEKALAFIMQRHPALRTSFHAGKATDMQQWIHKHVAPPLFVEDLSHLPPASQKARIDQWLVEEKTRGFRLDEVPLFRLFIHIRGATHFQLTLSDLHAVMDGWSVATFLTELMGTYFRLLRGNEPTHTQLKSKYADFIALEGKALKNDETRNFWREFTKDPPLSQFLRPPLQTANPKDQSYLLTLPGSLANQLTQFANSLEVPLRSVLLACHMKVLGALTRQEDVMTGLVSNGRLEQEDGDKVLGLFLNTLPMRIKLESQEGKSLVRKVYACEKQLFQHRRFPLFQIQRMNQNRPLFDSIFNFIHFHVYEALAEVPEMKLLDRTSLQPNYFALTAEFSLTPVHQQLSLQIGLHPSLAETVDIAAVADLYHQQLQAFINNRTLGADATSLYLPLAARLAAPTQPLASSDPLATPSSEAAFKLLKIWQDVFEIPEIGFHDHFFELGGHSLLAMKIVIRTKEQLGVTLSVKDLFDAPTVASLSRVMDQKDVNRDQETPIETTSGQTPLSFAQRRLWFLEQLEGHHLSYTIPILLQLDGALQEELLERVLREIVNRHEVLRSVILDHHGEPYSQVLKNYQWHLTKLECPESHHSQAEVWSRHELSRFARTPFDLAKEPPLRATLAQISPSRFHLLVLFHHSAFDGWSQGVFLKEVTTLYNHWAQGTQPPLQSLPLQYGDFAFWQQDQAQKGRLSQQMDYWKKRLQGLPSLLELPTDRPRPAIQGYRGSSISVMIPLSLNQGLKALGNRCGASLFMTLQASFAVLMARYSGQTDFALGTTIANRTSQDLEQLIGFFANTLVLRHQLKLQETFERYLALVRERTLEAFANQDVPFEQIVEVLQPERNLSHTPLFQILFELETATTSAATHTVPLKGVSVSQLGGEDQIARFDLSFMFTETLEGIHGKILFNRDLFDTPTIFQLFQNYLVLLEGIVANPDWELWKLPVVTQQETNLLLQTWNQTAVPIDFEESFLARFEAMCQLVPDRIAVSMAHQQLTYSALNTLSARMAGVFRQEGVQSERVVGLLAERDLTFLVTILAILKAGGVYLPIDPRYPGSRIQQILNDCHAHLLVGDDSLLRLGLAQQKNSGFSDLPTILHLEEIKNRATDVSPNAWVGLPEQCAYMIYTSGSTGTPKGAMVSFKGMLNHLISKQRALNLVETDIIAQNASQGFDISVWQFLNALLLGGKTAIFSDETALSPSHLLQRCDAEGITILEVVPTVMEMLLSSPNQETPALKSLRWLIPTGEALHPSLARKWLTRFPGIPLLNAYGPTECSDDVTGFELFQPPAKDMVHMPIGAPINNMQMFILDSHLGLLPRGVQGELLMGGKGVGRGYFAKPSLTAETFIPHPFSNLPGERLYRSGDLVRWLPDGNLVFLGRLDHQVKVRGFRIELGEIEARLNEVDKVQQAAVLAVKGQTLSQTHLVAFVQAAPPCDAEYLRRHLSKKLPDYMVPGQYVFLEKMPLNPNGKIDRKALPAPDQVQLSKIYIAPRSPLEAEICQVWAEVLGHSKVGIRDNFFELGGHSLLAMRLLSQLKTQLNIHLSLAQIFICQTIERLMDTHGLEKTQSHHDDLAFMNDLLTEIERNAPGDS